MEEAETQDVAAQAQPTRPGAYTPLSPYQPVTSYREAVAFGIYVHDLPAKLDTKVRHDAVQREQRIHAQQEADAEKVAYLADLHRQVKEMQDVQKMIKLSTPIILEADTNAVPIEPTPSTQIDTKQRVQEDATIQRHDTPLQYFERDVVLDTSHQHAAQDHHNIDAEVTELRTGVTADLDDRMSPALPLSLDIFGSPVRLITLPVFSMTCAQTFTAVPTVNVVLDASPTTIVTASRVTCDTITAFFGTALNPLLSMLMSIFMNIIGSISSMLSATSISTYLVKYDRHLFGATTETSDWKAHRCCTQVGYKPAH
jgi:hypothetical protein